MNALLLPLVLGLLVALAIKVLPKEHRLRGAYRVLIVCIVSIIITMGVFVGLHALGVPGSP
jgi:uncharacterized membrane protein YjjP (DUF1212 family)